MTVAVEMRNNAPLLCRGCTEIDGQHSAVGLQHSSYLDCALAAQLARQMMQHYRAQHDVKVGVLERERLGEPIRENNVRVGVKGLTGQSLSY